MTVARNFLIALACLCLAAALKKFGDFVSDIPGPMGFRLAYASIVGVLMGSYACCLHSVRLLCCILDSLKDNAEDDGRERRALSRGVLRLSTGSTVLVAAGWLHSRPLLLFAIAGGTALASLSGLLWLMHLVDPIQRGPLADSSRRKLNDALGVIRYADWCLLALLLCGLLSYGRCL